MKCDNCPHNIREVDGKYIHSKSKNTSCWCGCSSPTPYISKIKKKNDLFFHNNKRLIGFLMSKSVMNKDSFFTASELYREVDLFFDGKNIIYPQKYMSFCDGISNDEGFKDVVKGGLQKKLSTTINLLFEKYEKQIKKYYAMFCEERGILQKDWCEDQGFKDQWRINEEPDQNSGYYEWMLQNPMFLQHKDRNSKYQGYRWLLDFTSEELAAKAQRNHNAGNHQDRLKKATIRKVI